MIEQTQAHSDYSGASTKFRIIMIELEKLRGNSPADASTFVKTRRTVAHTLANIRQSEQAYKELRKVHLATNEDERTVEQLDPGAKIRAEIQGEAQKTTNEPGH